MIIRLATLNDIPQIMQVIAEVVPLMRASGNFQWDKDYPDADVFKNDIALNQLWVADMEGAIAGVTAITTDQSPEYAEVGWDINETAIVTHRLAVSPAFQGKGVAAALLAQAEQVAINLGITVLRVDTHINNQATQKLFPRLGYQLAGEIGLGFRPGMRFLCYQKIKHSGDR
ncbi:MAG: GNAT family N-acetyltransferase [Mucilaginibacter sp.]